jgi:uncharacterized membrane protein
MIDRDLTKGAAVAAAVMGLLLSAGCSSSDKDEVNGTAPQALKCLGGNECKGMSECAGGPSGSECKGLNECQAMGWIYTDTEAECDAAGGTIQAS